MKSKIQNSPKKKSLFPLRSDALNAFQFDILLNRLLRQ